MKKDKYPLAGGLISGDNSVPRGPNSAGQTNSNSAAAAAAAAASAAARDMYGSMNGYMPNGYYDNMYSQSPYGYGRYDSMSAAAMYSSAAAANYMNGSYMSSMYGANGSPYSSMAGPMSPEDGPDGVVAHPSHSPGSVKSEAGTGSGAGSGPPSGTSATVSMGSGSPGAQGSLGVPPPAGSGGPPPALSSVKREPMTGPGPLQSPGPGGPQSGPDLNRMISMYLPGEAAAAAAGDPHAQSRIQSFTNQVYAGHYGSLMSAGPGHGSHSPDPMGLPPPSAYPV